MNSNLKAWYGLLSGREKAAVAFGVPVIVLLLLVLANVTIIPWLRGASLREQTHEIKDITETLCENSSVDCL